MSFCAPDAFVPLTHRTATNDAHFPVRLGFDQVFPQCHFARPPTRSPGANLLTEIIGTFVLVLGILAIGGNKFADGLNPFIVGTLIWVIGLSLGGPTGYAINPARDLGPRIAHAILPITGKGGSDWGYSWIPVAGPVIGGVLGAFFYTTLF